MLRYELERLCKKLNKEFNAGGLVKWCYAVNIEGREVPTFRATFHKGADEYFTIVDMWGIGAVQRYKDDTEWIAYYYGDTANRVGINTDGRYVFATKIPTLEEAAALLCARAAIDGVLTQLESFGDA